MNRQVSVFAIFMLVFAAAPTFADEGEPKARQEFGFNILAKFINNAGKTEDGGKVWDLDLENRKTTQSAEEIKNRRKNQGVTTY